MTGQLRDEEEEEEEEEDSHYNRRWVELSFCATDRLAMVVKTNRPW